jgi:serine/threonine-protein kinase
MAESQPSWIGHIIGGRYKIEAPIAQGGMSVVYRALDPNLRRTVAVKLIHSHLSSNPEFVRRFEQEAAAVAQLRHPNIIQVYDFDHDEDVYFMVLEYVPGYTLQARLKALNETGQRLATAEAMELMATICDAVEYAHQRGMIHRDLKPANVILNPAGQPILMDFGVAKMLGEAHHTATGDVIGTVSYMAPEQARGERLDERADIYSLGVMLFEMATGQRPFEGDSAVTIMMKHLNEPVPDIRQMNTHTPDALVQVIEKALAKFPAGRYQSTAEMATALRAIARHNLPAEQPVAPTVVSRRAPRPAARPAAPTAARGRRPILLLGAGAIVAALALGLLVIAPRLGGPPLPSAKGMARVDGGVYLVGRDAAGDPYAPPQQVKLTEFWIDQYEVTNAQYAEFIAVTGALPPANWPGGALPAGQEQHPAQGVTWEQAAGYCDWANKRLPTEAEWEVAARGPEGLLYPWGNDVRAVELPGSETYAVGEYPANRSRYGAFDMAGNVWEWVGEPYAPASDSFRILRGGAFGFLKDMAYRLQGDPNIPTMIATAGIRCAAPKVSGDVARTGSPTPVAPAQLPAGVLYQDEFFDPQSGWPAGKENTHTFGYHPQSFYHLEVSAANDRLTIFRDLGFNDFSAETDVLVDHTDTNSGDFRYGLAIRRTGEQYYAFTVSPRTKTWQVTKHATPGVVVLAEGADDSIQGLGGVDQLRVDADGANFTLYVNDRRVEQVTDTDFSRGDVGFIVETLDETLAHVHYASLTLREAEGGHALFGDDFTNDKSGWPVQAEEHGKYGYHPPDFYHVEVSAPNRILTVFRGLRFDDFSAETEALVDHTDSERGNFRYGLAFRRTDNGYYAFAISPRTRTWQVSKLTPTGAQVLAEGSDDSIQTTSEADQLRVNASGANFTLYINGRSVAQVSDADYGNGDVGFVVETLDESLAHIHYAWLGIREADPVTVAPTARPAPTATPEPTATPLAVPEGMALIPAGYFQMGSSIGQPNEAPEHPALLDAFYIDRFEVTNEQFRECVRAGGCTQGRIRNSVTHIGYRDDAAYDSYPVIGVTWDQAVAFCSWAGKRLPSEAEWEYAASGEENLTWPWGNAFDASRSAAGARDAQPVDSYPNGASALGVLNLAGNVAEWVADVYDPAFYANSPASNPVNTRGGDTRIFRGGSFDNRSGAAYTTSHRYTNSRTLSDVDIGFRCARDATEVNARTPQAEREALVAEFCQIFSTYKPGAACP